MKNNWKKWLLWIGPASLILLMDRLFKMLFHDAEIVLIPGVLALTGAKNTGMAMGMMEGQPILLVALSIVLILVSIYFLRGYKIKGLAAAAISMIAGGAVGNAIDRIFIGYVIDMIEVLFLDFYIFNVADIGVVCGAVLCGVSLLFCPGEWEKR
ncbi:MAG: signal peptidase II [Clostridia bacterium]|nr:signal peptidase II [Clostridia bacterium]